MRLYALCLALDLRAARSEVAGGQVVAVGPGGERAVVAAASAERHVEVGAERHGPSVPTGLAHLAGDRPLPSRPHSASPGRCARHDP